MKQALLIFRECQGPLVDLISDYLSRRLHCSTKWCRNEDDARNFYKLEQPNLIIVEPAIAATSTQPVDPAEMRGLNFVKDIRRLDRKCPIIFFVEGLHSVDLQRVIQTLPRSRIIDIGTEWEPAIEAILEEWFDRPRGRAETQPGAARILIHLDLRSRTAQYSIQGGTFSVAVVPLKVWINVKQALYFSDAIGDDASKWPMLLEFLRDELMEGLFSETRFAQDYQKLLDSVGKPEKIEIKFSVESVAHPILLEAARYENQQEYWMLSSPISRSLHNVPSPGMQLFRPGDSRSGLSCLIIESNASGPVPDVLDSRGRPVELEELDTSTESKAVFELLNEANFHVELIQLTDTDPDPEKTLRRVLVQNKWDMVHYVGHSHFAPSTGSDPSQETAAYLFLPGLISPQKLWIAEFAKMLRDAEVQFIYLSSCSSARFGCILAEHQICSSIGFRWRVDSESATAMAQGFYEHLLQPHNSLQTALFNARCQMKENAKFKNDRIWAAPVLMSQGSEN